MRVGALVYVLGAFAAYRVRAVATPIEPIEPDALLELVRPDVSSAVWDMMALRAALGFALFQFGFSLRTDGEPAWEFGLVILANGVGGFTGMQWTDPELQAGGATHFDVERFPWAGMKVV